MTVSHSVYLHSNHFKMVIGEVIERKTASGETMWQGKSLVKNGETCLFYDLEQAEKFLMDLALKS